MRVEHRRYARYIPRKNAFAALGSQYNRVGKIIDIYLGGLVFEYISGENCGPNSSQVDIFLVGKFFHSRTL